MIYNKYNNSFNSLLLKIDTKNHDFLKKQAKSHDISLSFLINKILNMYIKNCKNNVQKM